MHPIEQIKTFTNLSPQVEHTLHNLITERTFRKGATIRGIANMEAYNFYIKSGAARVFITEHGKEITLTFAFEDEHIVIPRYTLINRPETITIQFLEPTTLLYLPKLKFTEIIKQNEIETTSALLFLMNALLKYTSHVEEQVYIMQTKNARERYQWLINRHPRIHNIATTTQIASYLGLTKETLYRIRNNHY